MMSKTILFDIGGTKMRVASTSDGKTIGEVAIFPTPPDFAEGIAFLKELADKEAQGRVIEKVSGCIAGIFNKDRQSLFRSPNLPDWEGKPLVQSLTEAFKVPVYIENDAAAAGLGEAIFGAGKNFHIVMYMTISTGVGAARIVGGKIDQRTYGFEPGQQLIDISNTICLEDLVSGTALGHRLGRHPRTVPADDKVWDELAFHLARGIHNSILHWSPDIIILGGSMILRNPAISIDKIREHLTKTLSIFPEIPVITKSALEDMSGLYGSIPTSS
jgi:predicted NBD/HSP70 family sugar kinase